MILNYRDGSSVIPLLLISLCYSTCGMGRARYLSSTPIAQFSVAAGLPTLELISSCVQPVATEGTVVQALCKW